MTESRVSSWSRRTASGREADWLRSVLLRHPCTRSAGDNSDRSTAAEECKVPHGPSLAKLSHNKGDKEQNGHFQPGESDRRWRAHCTKSSRTARRPPVLNSTRLQSNPPVEVGREEAIQRRAAHWVPAGSRARIGGEGCAEPPGPFSATALLTLPVSARCLDRGGKRPHLRFI
jgi:hypothetical protein